MELRFDCGRQRIDCLPRFPLKLGRHELDPEVPFDVEYELKNVHGVDSEIAVQEQLIIRHLLRRQILNTQAVQNQGFQLIANIFSLHGSPVTEWGNSAPLEIDDLALSLTHSAVN